MWQEGMQWNGRWADNKEKCAYEGESHFMLSHAVNRQKTRGTILVAMAFRLLR